MSPSRTLSEIKLKRTDTTLDLSQKAKRAKEEKKKSPKGGSRGRYLYDRSEAVGSGRTESEGRYGRRSRDSAGITIVAWELLPGQDPPQELRLTPLYLGR